MAHTLISISGASAAGKTTLQANLSRHFGSGTRVRTVTTRERRYDESEDSYQFVTPEWLRENNGDLLWDEPLYGSQYSVSFTEIFRALNARASQVAHLAIDPKSHLPLLRYGANRLQGVHIIVLHLLSPPEDELRRRLWERPGTREEQVETRIRESRAFDDFVRNNVPSAVLIPPGTVDFVTKCALEATYY